MRVSWKCLYFEKSELIYWFAAKVASVILFDLMDSISWQMPFVIVYVSGNIFHLKCIYRIYRVPCIPFFRLFCLLHHYYYPQFHLNCCVFECLRRWMALSHWPLGDLQGILNQSCWGWFQWVMAGISDVKLPADECHWIFVMISQHWFG